MSSIKGLAERERSINNFSLTTEDGRLTIDFSLREPSGTDETIEFVDDFRKTSKHISKHVVSREELDKLSMDEKLDIVDKLFEVKFRFCTKWLKNLNIEEISENDAIKAYELIGRIDSEEDESLYYNIIKTCKLLDVEKIPEEEEDSSEDFTG